MKTSQPKLLRRRNEVSRPQRSILILWLCAAVAVLPLVLRGPSCGSDFLFHFTSWHDALRSWRHGILYPHWTSSANFGAGEPRFVFYSPLTWMLGALLGSFLPWRFVPVVIDLLFFGLTGVATCALARRFLPDVGAVLAGAAAIFSGYELYEAYFHDDFAMLTGGFWIPLLVLLAMPEDTQDSSQRRPVLDKRTLPLALVIAGCWLCNAPLGLMASYLAVTLALLAAVQLRSWQPLVRITLPIALGLGLIAFYLVPVAAEQHWIDIQKLFSAPEHLIQNRWITTELAGPPHHLYPSQRARGVIEALMLLMALGGYAALRLRDPWQDVSSSLRHRWSTLVTISFLVLFLMLPVSLPVWNLLPRLRYLEYPWRWLVVLQAPMAVLFAGAILSVRPRFRSLALALCAAFFLLGELGAGTNRHLFSACSASRTNPMSIAGMNTALQTGGAGVGGTDEYSAPGARIDLVPTPLPDACLVRDASAVLGTLPATGVSAFYTPRAWSPALGTCEAVYRAETPVDGSEHLHLAATVASAGYLVLRLRSYPAWRIVENGQRLSNLPQRADGLLAVPVQAGPVDVRVSWETTSDVLLGRGLSAASVLIALLLAWRIRSGNGVGPTSPLTP